MERAILGSKVPLLKRCEILTLAGFKMDADGRSPIYLQVYDFVRQAILRGDLPPGFHLPSTRALARSLHISRNTVLNAYEALALEGYLTGKPGAGTFVCNHGSPENDYPRLKVISGKRLLRDSHYPASPSFFGDPYGNLLYVHR
jgi:DNA-binding GntR family transcriptional regulator